MSRWFRHYAGMMRDEKLVSAAIRSKQTVERVVWIWGVILESAAEIDDNGRFDVDGAEIAYFLRADQADIDAVLAALTDAGRLVEGRVGKWGDRQFTSDRSASRQAAYRERKRGKVSDGDDQKGDGDDGVTSRSRHADAPDTESETDNSVANATVGEADDPLKVLFDTGVKLLTAAGQTEKQARSLIGKWRKGRSDGDVLTALIDCRARAISEPVEWLQKRFGGVKHVSASGYEYRGSDRDILREAERRGDMATFWAVKSQADSTGPPKRKSEPPADPKVANILGQATSSLRLPREQRARA